MFLHSLEIVTIVILGVMYLFPELLESQSEQEVRLEKPAQTTMPRWFHKLARFISKLEGSVARRIHSDSCCICYESIKHEVQSCCGHVFCGSCLFQVWKPQPESKISCPLCRKQIETIISNSSQSFDAHDCKDKEVLQNIEAYNSQFSSQPQDLQEALSSLQTLATNFFLSFSHKRKLHLFIQVLLGMTLAAAVIVPFVFPSMYIIVQMSTINWIESVLFIAFCLLYISKEAQPCKSAEKDEISC